MASGTEVESFTGDSISRRKRQKRKSRRTNSIASSEEHLSYCPDTMHSSETMHSNDLETLGGFNHCQNRYDLNLNVVIRVSSVIAFVFFHLFDGWLSFVCL